MSCVWSEFSWLVFTTNAQKWTFEIQRRIREPWNKWSIWLQSNHIIGKNMSCQYFNKVNTFTINNGQSGLYDQKKPEKLNLYSVICKVKVNDLLLVILRNWKRKHTTYVLHNYMNWTKTCSTGDCSNKFQFVI